MRVSKKDMDKNFRRPRQCLLSAKRKDRFENSMSIISSRTKSSPIPYMNTRSVTRKMCNVGATYQAPTIRDETQWKEWPVHGMHERPIFHPQVRNILDSFPFLSFILINIYIYLLILFVL